MSPRSLRMATIAVCFGIAWMQSALAQQRYDATALYGMAEMADDGSLVIGKLDAADDVLRWHLRRPDGTLKPMPEVPDGSFVNNLTAHQLVGGYWNKDDCVKLEDGFEACALLPFLVSDDLLTKPGTLGGRNAALLGVNSHGVAVGWSEVTRQPDRCYPDGPRVSHAVIFREGKLEDLGLLGGTCAMLTDINDAGDMIGVATDATGHSIPFLMRDGVTTPVRTLAGASTSIWALNTRGDMAGQSETPDGVQRPVIVADGQILDLGTLGGQRGVANDINDAGVAVGSSHIPDGNAHAFVYDGGLLSDLNRLVDWRPDQLTSDVAPVLAVAWAIGAHGEILARTVSREGDNYFLLTPKLGIGPSFARPGMTFTYRISGDATSADSIGDDTLKGDLIYRIVDVTADGIGWEFARTSAAPLRGTQHVNADDLAGGGVLHTALMEGDNSGVGLNALPRVSDLTYALLSVDLSASFSFDSGSTTSMLTPDGTEDVTLVINDQPTAVRAIRAATDDDCHVWIADEPGFPLLLKTDCGPLVVASAAYDPSVVSQAIVDALDGSATAATGTILFAFNSAEITPESRPILDGLATYLRGRPGFRLVVEGHTDSIGTAAANDALSLARAEAVKAHMLAALGQTTVEISAVGRGFTRPIADNATEEGRARNRRVVFSPAP